MAYISLASAPTESHAAREASPCRVVGVVVGGGGGGGRGSGGGVYLGPLLT